MEHVMKLSSEKLESVLEQIDVKVIPDDHPSLPKLRDAFGDHTFSSMIAVSPSSNRWSKTR
jgi:hypothetical protein